MLTSRIWVKSVSDRNGVGMAVRLAIDSPRLTMVMVLKIIASKVDAIDLTSRNTQIPRYTKKKIKKNESTFQPIKLSAI